MKKIHILTVLLGLVGASCSNQELADEYVGAEQVKVTADITRSRVSFTEIDEETYANWENGDAITLTTPTQSNLNYSATVTESTVTFAPDGESLKDIAGETVYACYPAATITDGTVALPATKDWSDAKPLPFAYAVSTIADSKVNLAFEHTFAFLKITFSSKALENATSTDGDKTVHRLSVKSASGSLGVISGTFSFEEKTINVTEKTDEIEVTLTEVFQPTDETERSVYVPLLPQAGNIEMSIGLIHNFEGGEDVLKEIKKQTPADGFEAGRVYKLNINATEDDDKSEGNDSSTGTIEGETGDIHLGAGGQLSTFITAENKNSIKSLKLSGFLNGDDIKLLREMAGVDVYGRETEGQLTDLDLSEATIVEGGGCYYDSTTDYFTSNNIWGAYFFMDSKLKNVTLPKSITEMRAHAFENCASLENIEIPERVTHLGGACFRNSTLKSITLPESLKTIAEYAFYDCKSLTEISMKDNVEVIQQYAFNGCTSLTSVSLGKGVQSIGNCTFKECSKLLSLTIPENAALTTIGIQAFENCDYLTSLTIPDGIAASIGERAFYSCDALANVNLGNAVTSIGAKAFQDCASLAVVTMGDAVTEIGNNAFENCKTLARFTMSKGLVSLGTSAFHNCSTLPTISIPEGVSMIGDETFYGCTTLNSIVIPDAVTSIGQRAFEGCSSLTDVTIGENVTTIDNYAFRGCKSIKNITIPDAVTNINVGVFQECTSLEEIPMGTHVKTIGNNVFYKCSALKEVILPEDIESVGRAVFQHCTSIIRITNLIADNDNICDECTSLTDITISPKTTKIGSNTFKLCSALTNVVLPEGILEIDNGAFSSCTSLEEISIPESVILMDNNAFLNCKSLKSFVIPEKLTVINGSVFQNCEALTNIVIPNNITNIKTSAFEGTKSLTKLTLGKNLTNIESCAFGRMEDNFSPISECISYAATPPILVSGFSKDDEKVSTAKLYVPKGSLTAYQESDWAIYFGNIIEMEE